MEENIVTNENVVEATKELVEKSLPNESFRKGSKFGYLVVGAVGGLAGQYLIKRIVSKVREIRSSKKVIEHNSVFESDEAPKVIIE